MMHTKNTISFLYIRDKQKIFLNINPDLQYHKTINSRGKTNKRCANFIEENCKILEPKTKVKQDITEEGT